MSLLQIASRLGSAWTLALALGASLTICARTDVSADPADNSAVPSGPQAQEPETTGSEPVTPPVPQAERDTPLRRLRILFLDESPRWEYRYLRMTLSRVHESIGYQAFLFDARQSFPQESSDALPSLTGIPRTAKEFADYDAVILGDVPPTRFGATEAAQREWLEQLQAFVARGGGLICSWGGRAMPDSYRGTTLEAMLPIDLPEQPQPVRSERDVEFDLVLGPQEHPAQEALAPGGMRAPRIPAFAPFSLVYPVAGLRNDAEVFLTARRKDAGNGAEGEDREVDDRPLAIHRRHERGKVLFLATDETWRLRSPYGETYYDAFWHACLRAVARPNTDGRYTLELDAAVHEPGASVQVTLRIEPDPKAAEPRPETFELFHRTPDGAETARNLQAVPGEPGLSSEPGVYRATFALEQPGLHSFLVRRGPSEDAPPLLREDVLVR